MRLLIRFSIVFILSIFLFIDSDAKNTPANTYRHWEAGIQEMEISFQQGYYSDVLSKGEKLLKNISNSQYKNDAYLARVTLYVLRANLAKNEFAPLPVLLDSSLAQANRIPKDSLVTIYLVNKGLIDYYLEAGYADKADKLASALIKQFTPVSYKYYSNQCTLQFIEALLMKGNVVDAMKHINALESSLMSLVLNRKLGDDGYVMKNKVSTHVFNARKLNFAHLMNLKASACLLQGDYHSAEVVLNTNYVWLKKNIGTKNSAYREYCKLRADWYLVDNNHKMAAKYYYKGFKVGGLRKAAQAKLELNELLVNEYILTNKPSKVKKFNRNLQLTSKRAYGKKNFYYQGKEFIEVRQKIEKNNNAKAANQLNDIFLEFPNMPDVHPKKLPYIKAQFDLSLRAGDLETANQALNTIISINKALLGENAPLYHQSKLLQASYLVKYGSEFKKAEEIYKESFVKIVQPQLLNTHNSYATFLNNYAELYEITERYDQAYELRANALESSKMRYGEKDIQYAYELELLAELLLQKGEYTSADTLLKKALRIAKAQSNQNNPKVVETYQGVAKLYSTLGYYDEAKQMLNKAYTASNKYIKKQALDAAETADELAELYLKTGSYNDAEDLLKEAIALKEKKMGANNRELISSFNLLGKVYLATGNYAESEKNIRKAQKIATKFFADSTLKATESLLLLEELYLAIGDFPKVEANLTLALKNQQRILGKKHILVANTMTRLALIQLKQAKKSHADIEALLNEATAIIKSKIGTKNPIYADQLKDMAHFYYETHQYEKADTLLGVANVYWVDKLTKYNVHTAEILMIRGDISSNMALYDKAEQNYGKAREVYQSVFSSTHPDYVNATSKQARIFYIKNQHQKSLDLLEETTHLYLDFTKKYFPSLSFREKNKYWNLIKDDFEFYNSLVFKMKDNKPALLGDIYNNVIATKALLLSSSIKVKQRILSSNDTTLVNKYKEYVALKEFVTGIISMSPQQLKELNVDPKAIEKEIETIEKELSEKSEDFAMDDNKKRNITWKDIRNTLKPNEYAVELIRFRYFDKSFTDSVVYAAMIIAADTKSQPEVVVIPNGKLLETRYINYFRNAVKFKNEDAYSYKMFWKAIKDKLPDGATVYLSSEGVYNQLNVEMLQSPEGKYGLDQNNFVLVSNTKDLVLNALELKAKSKKGVQNNVEVSDIVLLGNPQFYKLNTDESGGNHNVSQLEGAEKEVEQLYNFLSAKGEKVQKFIGKNVTEEAIKNLKNPRVFHIATHAYFKEDVPSSSNNEESEFASNPLLNSGLLLSGAGDIIDNKEELNVNAKNGVLTALEASNLYFDNTELVVLSACETGLGQVQVGEGVYGLQRSFLVAGANSIVMSLFKVNDEVTQKLMVLFYEKWKATGNKRKAFNDAKKEIKAQYNFPIFWGSFVMIGV
jgi:tetratricopeptide (TPR) repeat protein